MRGDGGDRGIVGSFPCRWDRGRWSGNSNQLAGDVRQILDPRFGRKFATRADSGGLSRLLCLDVGDSMFRWDRGCGVEIASSLERFPVTPLDLDVYYASCHSRPVNACPSK